MRKIITFLLIIIVALPCWALTLLSYNQNTLSKLTQVFIATNSGSSRTLGLQDIGVNSLLEFSEDSTFELLTIPEILDSEIEAKILDKSLPFPNPFKFSDGTTIRYSLSKSMDIELKVYDIFCRKIYQKTYIAGTQGGLGQPFYNIVKFDKSELNQDLSSGVYFYVLMHKGKLLCKNKMMVLP